MRIGMVTDTFLPLIGGAELHVLELARALRELGDDVEIATAWSGPDEVDGFPVLRLPELARGSARRALVAFSAWRRLAALVDRVDVVHCHYTYLMAFMATALARVLGKPRVVTLHGLGTLDSSVRRSPVLRLYRSASFRRADVAIATSHEMRAVAERFVDGSRVPVIPNGVNTDYFDPERLDAGSLDAGSLGAGLPGAASGNGDGPVILAMRRLAPKNGVQYLVEAAPIVLRSLPGAQFWISGRDKLEAHLRRRVQQLGIDANVRFLGEVPVERTRSYFARADIVVFPSSAESTSLACLEAMSMRRAVVASALSAYREMLGDGERGVLVDLFGRDWSDYDAPATLPHDRIAALGNAIVELGLDPDRRRSLGDRAREFVRSHFDWRIVAQRTRGLYEGLLA